MNHRLKIDVAALQALPAGQRAQALQALKDLEAAYAWNPMLAYEPASCRDRHVPGAPCEPECKHAAFHRARTPVKALFGGNRAGKTTTAIADDLIQATPRELLPAHLQAYKKWECPFYCRVMAPDMQRTMIPVIHQKFREWTPKSLLRGGSFDKSYDKTAQSLRLECGCRFDFLSYEMDVDKFGGAALHRCHYDEEPPESIRRECLMRLIDFNGDEILSMTPLKGYGWTWRDIWRKESPHHFKIAIGIGENPHLSADARERILDSITDPREREAREFGAFVHFGGLVYPDWRASMVAPKPTEQLRTMDHVCGIDPGVRFAGLTFAAFDDDNRSHTYASRKLRDATAPDYVQAVREVLGPRGIRVEDVHFVIDPAGRARSLVNAESIQDELGRYGIYCNAGQNEVQAGILQLRRRMKSGWSTIADPDMGGDTQSLVEELEMYRLEVDPDEDDGQFKVLKQHDHVCDSWRYLHMERPWLPEQPEFTPERAAWWEVAGPPPRRTPGGSVMGWGA